MQKKIIFQKCNFNNIYFLFIIIIIFIELLIENKLTLNEEELNKIKNEGANVYLPTRILINLYITNLSDFLAIIPHLIRKRLLKKKQEKISSVEIEDYNHDDGKNLIYNDSNISLTNKKKKTILLFIILVGILDFLEKFALILYNIINPDKEFDIYPFSCVAPFEISFQFICSYFILKMHFYKLQYFSLFLNLGIFIIILIIDIVKLSTQSKENSYDGKIFIFYLFNLIFYSVEYSIGKRILLYGFISIYLLIIINGVVVLILNLLFSLIIYLVNKKIFSVIGAFFTNKEFILLMFAKIFSSFFASLFTWLIIDKFSPNYLPIAFLCYDLCIFILYIIFHSTQIKIEWDLFVRIFLYLVSAIGVMIHNEVVVINICNLGSDTKYFLDLQVESDELFAKTDNPEIMKRYESEIDIESDNENSNENNGPLYQNY